MVRFIAILEMLHIWFSVFQFLEQIYANIFKPHLPGQAELYKIKNWQKGNQSYCLQVMDEVYCCSTQWFNQDSKTISYMNIL